MQSTAWFFGLAAIVVAGAAAPAATAQPGEGHATARLVAEFAALVPGQTNYLGVAFEIDPEWHTYWNGNNDTGFPITIELGAPEGYEIGAIQWPAPKRYIAPGDLLDHIYEGKVTLIIPVEVPIGAKGEATFTGSANWLVCKEACLPGDASLKLTVPVGGERAGKPSGEAPLFAKARERIPVPLPDENPPVSYILTGDAYVFEGKGARYMAFYPAEDCVKLENPLRDGESDKGTLKLELADFSPGPRLKGVLEVRKDPKGKGGEGRFFMIDLPISETATPLRMPGAR